MTWQISFSAASDVSLGSIYCSLFLQSFDWTRHTAWTRDKARSLGVQCYDRQQQLMKISARAHVARWVMSEAERLLAAKFR